jgi:hypothetical protein
MAANLKTHSATMAGTEVVSLQVNSDRERLAVFEIDPTNQTDVRLWVGQLPPPVDTSLWIDVSTTDTILRAGAIGPVYIANVGGQAAKVAAVSTLVEGVVKSDTVEESRFLHCPIADLTADDGITHITDDAGTLLAVCI